MKYFVTPVFFILYSPCVLVLYCSSLNLIELNSNSFHLYFSRELLFIYLLLLLFILLLADRTTLFECCLCCNFGILQGHVNKNA